MLVGVGLIVGGIILLFIALSIIGLIMPKPDDQDSAASGLIQRR